MPPIAEILRDEIARSGPLLFSRFMETALYHPELGYYRRIADPFGRAGDFYTAEQIQPVFGRLIAQYAKTLLPHGERTIVELGAGRREMAPYFGDFHYVPVDVGYGEMPESFSGLVFANEFFDALPVDVVVKRGGELLMARVMFANEHFAWTDGEAAPAPIRSCLAEAAVPLEDGARLEVNMAALDWMERIAKALTRGRVLIIDYGYTQRESIRFPEGTLMSYHHHLALDDVLAEPGTRDITAHVPFSALEAQAARSGLTKVRFESMAAMLLRAGEADHFGSALAAEDEKTALAHRMKLKTLLIGMGETFRTLLLERC